MTTSAERVHTRLLRKRACVLHRRPSSTAQLILIFLNSTIPVQTTCEPTHQYQSANSSVIRLASSFTASLHAIMACCSINSDGTETPIKLNTSVRSPAVSLVGVKRSRFAIAYARARNHQKLHAHTRFILSRSIASLMTCRRVDGGSYTRKASQLNSNRSATITRHSRTCTSTRIPSGSTLK
jgi:hypothetical protein